MNIARSLAGFLTACTLSSLCFSAHADTVALDSTYASGGKLYDSSVVGASGMVLQGSSKIVVTSPAPNSDLGASRYLSNGTLDMTFGTNGRIGTTFSGYGGNTYAIASQSDGKIILVGSVAVATGSNGFSECAIARYTANGVLDTTFSGDGKIVLDPGALYSVVVQPDGKIVASGGGRTNSQSSYSSILYRFDADGSLDTTFSGDGKIITNNNAPQYSGFGAYGYGVLALQGDSKIVAAGTYDGAFLTARFNTDGSADTSFGTNGTVAEARNGGADVPRALTVLNSGNGSKIIVVGWSGGPGPYIEMVRYNPNGTPDTTLNPSGTTPGKMFTTFGSNAQSEGYAFRPLVGGKFLIAGSIGPSDNRRYAIGRFLNNGSPDLTFNTNGYVSADFPGISDIGYDLDVQSDGKLLLCGSATNALGVARFTITTSSTATTTSSSASGS